MIELKKRELMALELISAGAWPDGYDEVMPDLVKRGLVCPSGPADVEFGQWYELVDASLPYCLAIHYLASMVERRPNVRRWMV